MCTVATLRYLVHGGRISHIRGLLGSVLNIKPLIGVDKSIGKYAQMGQTRTMNQALVKMTEMVAQKHKPGSALRVQVLHGHNPEGAAFVRERLDTMFDCTWLPTGSIAPVLGAHTGPGLVGVAFAPAAAFADVPAVP
jgi:DegV family protein with EDD domain